MTDITERRVDQLADQLAGLQRLVETLANERGEFGQSLTHHSKTLVEHAAALDRHEEQLRDDYIMRPAVPIVEGAAPHDVAKIAAEHWQSEGLAQFQQAQRLRAEVERLRNELVNAPAWAAYDELTAEVRRLSDVDAMAGRLKAIVGPLWSEAYCVEVAKGLVGR